MGKSDDEIKAFLEVVGKEKRMITRELKRANVPAHKMKVLAACISNTAFMRVKLDEIRAQIKEADIIVEYDNGGGQKGTRENPLFKGYESLWKSYMLGMSRILDAIPDEKEELQQKAEEVAKPQTVLEMVRAKYQAAP